MVIRNITGYRLLRHIKVLICSKMVQEDLTELIRKFDFKEKNPKLQSTITACYKKLLAEGNDPHKARQIIFGYLVKEEKYDLLCYVFQRLFNDSKESATVEPDIIMFVLYAVYKSKKLGSDPETTKVVDFDKYLSVADNYSSKDSISELERQVLHIVAQDAWKQKNPEKAFGIYKKLLETPNDLDNTFELLCNKYAAFSAIPYFSEVKENISTVGENDTYDILYNKALGLCQLRDYNAALAVSTNALELAQKEEADLDDQRSIKLQLSYIHQLIGQYEEAKTLLKDVLDSSIDKSDMLYRIAKLNLKSFTDFSKFKDNMPLILREIEANHLVGSYNELSKQQFDVVSNNIESLKLFSNGTINRSTLPHSIANKFYSKNVNNVVLEPYEDQAEALSKKSDKYLVSGTKDSKTLLIYSLVCIQLLVKAKNLDKAISRAEKIWNHFPRDELSKEKRVISYILLKLYDEQNRSHSTSKHIEKLHKLFTEESLKEDPLFWEFIGFKLLEQGRIPDAERIFRGYAEINPNSASAKYMKELASTDILTTDIDKIIGDVDVETIISSGISVFEKTKSKTTAIRPTPKKKRRVHKNKKLPKSYDENKKPDPERWLPLKERSTYRVSKKNIGKNTQGSKTSKASEAKLDITKKAAKKTNKSSKSKSSRRH